MAGRFSIIITLIDELDQASTPCTHPSLVAKELQDVCRHRVPFLRQLTSSLQANDTRTARTLLLNHPVLSSSTEFHALPTLCKLLGRDGLALEVGRGCAFVKARNIPLLQGEHAATLASEVQSELAGAFGVLFCAKVVGKGSQATPRPLSVHVSVTNESLDRSWTVPLPNVNQPSFVAVIEVDRTLNKRLGKWCANSTAHVLHRHRVEVVGILERFMFMWFGPHFSWQLLFTNGNGDFSEDAAVWEKRCDFAMSDVKFTSRHFILVTWDRKLHHQLLVLCSRLLRLWLLSPRIVASRCIRSQDDVATKLSPRDGSGGGGGGGGGGGVDAAAAANGDDTDVLDEVLLRRDTLSSILGGVFKATFVASFVGGITDEELLDSPFDVAWWAQEAVETWFEDGDVGASLDGLLHEGEADAVRAYYSGLGWSLDNFDVATVVLGEHLDEIVAALPDVVTDAAGGSWVDCKIKVGTDGTVTVPVYKAGENEKGPDIEEKVKVRKRGLNRDGASKLWYHGARYRKFPDLAKGMCVNPTQPSFRKGNDFGPGFCLADTLRFARKFIRGTKKVVAVYRDPGKSRGPGTRFDGATELWKKVVCIGCTCGRTHPDFKSALSTSGHKQLKDITGSSWIEGPMVNSHINVRNGAKPAEPKLKEGTKEMEVQVVVRKEPEAGVWYRGLVAIIVFGCPSPAATTTGAGAGAGAGTGETT